MVKSIALLIILFALHVSACGERQINVSHLMKDSLLTDLEIQELGKTFLRITKRIEWGVYSLIETENGWSDSLVDSLGTEDYIELPLQEFGFDNTVSAYLDLANDSAPEYSVRYTFHKDIHPLIEGGHWVEYSMEFDSAKAVAAQQEIQKRYPKEEIGLQTCYSFKLKATSLDTMKSLFPEIDSSRRHTLFNFWTPDFAEYSDDQLERVERRYSDDNLIVHSGYRTKGNIARTMYYKSWEIQEPYRVSKFYKEGKEGRVTVRFLIDENGTVFYNELISSSFNDFSFEERVLNMVRQIDFSAIKQTGDMTDCSYEFKFNMPEGEELGFVE